MDAHERGKRLLILGLCSVPMGTMERQLGNMAILIPMLDSLREHIPNVEIRTSLQLSDEFCTQHDLVSLKVRSLYEPTPRSGLMALLDFLRVAVWKGLRSLLRIDARFFLAGEKLQQYRWADVVVDFSGDVFGDAGHPLHLLKHSLDIAAVQVLGKPVHYYAQSPGPFSTGLRRLLGRITLGRATVISTREPAASTNLRAMGLPAPVVDAACPSYLLVPDSDKARDVLLREDLEPSAQHRLGVTICGFNFSTELLSHDKYRLSRPVNEMLPFVRVLQHAISELNLDVLLIPHVFRTDSQGRLIEGPDSHLSRQLLNLFREEHPEYADRIALLSGIYDTAIAKGIIGTCDLYLSGRLHAGVAALSQAIPTVLVAYGRKFMGFARLLGQEDLVSPALRGAINADDLIHRLTSVWKRREQLGRELAERLPAVCRLAHLNSQIVRDLFANGNPARLNSNSPLVRQWMQESERALESVPEKGKLRD